MPGGLHAGLCHAFLVVPCIHTNRKFEEEEEETLKRVFTEKIWNNRAVFSGGDRRHWRLQERTNVVLALSTRRQCCK